MQLYPALDLRAGGIARAAATVDPVRTLQAWHAAGAAWAHVADLDRAFGTGDNTAIVRALCGTSGPRVQLGGGLVGDAVSEAIGWGAGRVVVGAHGAAGLARLVVAHGPDRIAVALDLRNGVLERPAGRTVGNPDAVLETAVAAGVRAVVVRDLARDGTLAGAGLEAAGRLRRPGLAVIVAGGVATLDDLRAARDAGFAGVIVGRALLEGRFPLEEALACCG